MAKRRQAAITVAPPERVPTLPPPNGFPSAIKVLSQTWRVIYTDPLDDYGRCLDGERVILIKAGQSSDSMADTLLHEALHAISMTLDIKLTEDQVHALAPALIDLLRVNMPWWRA